MKDKCQVCGCSDVEEYEDLDGGRNSRLVCGGSYYLGCRHAERLAISRAAEIERLRAALERIAAQDANTFRPDWLHWRAIARNALTETKPQENNP